MGDCTFLDISWPNSIHYKTARIGRVINHKCPKRFPFAAVRTKSDDDVVAVVSLAQNKECRISIRSGRFSWAAWSVRDNAILLELDKLPEVDFNSTSRLVRASSSTTGHMLNICLDEHGLMFGGGHSPNVGLGGLPLQDNMGWNCRGWNWAFKEVCGINVVTADGRTLHCSQNQNDDLFWAARGGGPGFPGISTRFHLGIRDKRAIVRS